MPFQYRVRSQEQMEARLNQSSGNFISYIKSEYRTFSPQKNENCIRILPPSNLWENAPHWGLDVFVHFGIGPERASVICLDRGVPQIGVSGGACPICQEMYRAMRVRDETTIKECRPVKRVLTFLLNRRDEGQGVLIWGVPNTVDQKFQKAAKSREDGTFRLVDDPEHGHDIYFDKEGEQLLTKYEGVQLATRSSSVNPRWVDYVNDNPLPECLVWRTFEEVQKIFEGGVNANVGGERYERPRNGGSERPPREAYSERPREYERPREREYEDRGFSERPSERPPREASDDREPPPHEDEDNRDPQEPWDDRNPNRQEPEQEPERRAEPERPRADDRPIRRPGSSARGNGADTAPPRASIGKDRAAELRAQFLSGGRK